MRVEHTSLPGVLVIEPTTHPDDRGAFFESWERDRYAEHGLPTEWRQDNAVESKRGVLRGMHFQHPNPQHKLVYVLVGEIFDVAVDVRFGSPTFGKWFGTNLSAGNRRQLSVPPGFAHGYQVLSERSVVIYKCSHRYDPASERGLRWNDPAIAIDWPIAPTIIAPRDAAAPLLADYAPETLPTT
jgi:dTDP-4-dehydrorhamnose 3,5-epimerase